MPAIARILVALDGSPRAPDVLAAARDLARQAGARLWLFRAVGVPVDVPREAYVLSPDQLAVHLQERAAHELEQLARDLPEGLVAATRAVLGTPWRAICDAARDYGVDLVVIGSHGYHGIDRVLGTTAAKVVNHADRSVLVVKPPH